MITIHDEKTNKDVLRVESSKKGIVLTQASNPITDQMIVLDWDTTRALWSILTGMIATRDSDFRARLSNRRKR